MSQNAHGQFRSGDDVDRALERIMGRIQDVVAKEGRAAGRIDYRRGASLAGYRKLADAITACGVI